MDNHKINNKSFFWISLLVVALFFIAVSIPNLIKGFHNHSVWGKYLWYVSYEYGFIKRGFLGSIFQLAVGNYPYEVQNKIIVYLYSLSVLGLFLMVFCHLLILTFKAQIKQSSKVLFFLLIGLLSISPVWPTLANTTGYPDVFAFMFCYLAFIGFLYKKISLVIFSIIVGILIHEIFLFIWLSVLCLMFYECAFYKRNKETVQIFVLSVLVPIISYLVINFFHNNDALNRVLLNIGFLSDGDREILYNWQFNQTVIQATHRMLNIFSRYQDLFLIKAIYFLSIPFVYCFLLILSSLKNSPNKILKLMIFFLVIFSPLLTLLFAWDLSRLLLYTGFSSVLLLLYILHKEVHIYVASKALLIVLSAGLLCSVTIFAKAPLVYSYFNNSDLVGGGQHKDNIGKRISAWIVENDYRTGIKKTDKASLYLDETLIPGKSLNAIKGQICADSLCGVNQESQRQMLFREYKIMYSGIYLIELHYSSIHKTNQTIGSLEIVSNNKVLKVSELKGTEGNNIQISMDYKLSKGDYNSTIHVVDLYLLTDKNITVNSLAIKLIK